MRVVRLASEIDFAGWRKAARALRAEGVEPRAVVWTVERELFDLDSPPAASGEGGSFTVPAAFVELARTDRAKALLETSDWPLARVAERAGFGSLDGLHRAFQKRVGATPGEYRERFGRRRTGPTYPEVGPVPRNGSARG